ncbi:hypothetical protein ACWDBP_43440 [Streptomyces sp. NPDC001233]
MSMRPKEPGEMPAGTAWVANAAFPKGSLATRPREEFGALFTNEQFAGLFPSRGKPARSPRRLAPFSITASEAAAWEPRASRIPALELADLLVAVEGIGRDIALGEPVVSDDLDASLTAASTRPFGEHALHLAAAGRNAKAGCRRGRACDEGRRQRTGPQ